MIIDGDVLASNDSHRVIVRSDLSPHVPDGDVHVPQTMRPILSRQRTDLQLNMGRDDGEWLQDALDRFEDAWHDVPLAREAFGRWARVFHGVNAEVFDTSGYSQGDSAEIIAWPGEEWRELVGVGNDYTPGLNDVAELAAYIWGDVFILAVEQLTRWTSNFGEVVESWEMVDTLGGFYLNHGTGNEYVTEVAKELLGEHDAS